jgi:ketosteroid isomerase-like protein
MTMTIKALLETYYDGLQKRSGWEQTIADDFVFESGSPNGPARGKAAYTEAVHRFGRVFETVSIKQMTIQGDTACVIATYNVVSPAGKKTTVDIAEVWTARDGRLTSLTIYYDTARWQAFMAA